MGDIGQGSMPNLAKPTLNGPSSYNHYRSASSGATGHKKKEKESLKKRIKKEDIGMPQDFRHVSHVGWDPNKGFDVDLAQIEDPNLKMFFAKVSITHSGRTAEFTLI